MIQQVSWQGTLDRKRFFRIHTPEELEAKILENPITDESLCALVKNNRISISLVNEERPKYGLAYFCRFNGGIPEYHILLSRLAPLWECVQSFSHELTHIHYCCAAPEWDKNTPLIESIIEREALAAATKYSLILSGIFTDLGGLDE